MLRQIPRSRCTRTMWRMWSVWGYSCRPRPDLPRRENWVAVEFWIEAPTASDDVLASYEWELDDALMSPRVRTKFFGVGSRLER